MKQSRILTIALLLLAAAVPAALLAVDDIPLTNWTVPPYHGRSGSGGITTMTDVTPGIAFVGVTPCRLVDTRGNGFTGAYGPPSLAGGVPRNFDLNSAPSCTGIPVGVEAYSLNITVTNTAGPGFILIYPQGGSQPTVSTLNYTGAGQTVANAAIVPAGTGGGVTVIAGVSGTNLIIDINGYFTDDFENNNHVIVNVNSTQYAILASNALASCTSTCGMLMQTAGGHAIEGDANGTGEVYGVYGYSNGDSDLAAGVRGQAVLAQANGGYFSNAGISGEAATFLATRVGGVDYSVYSSHRILGGSLVISGAPKSFAAPHPDDPGLEIRYASVEAPTVDVYFRGTGELRNGIARIEVPDHFRYTALEGTYMTTLTSVGRASALTVESEGPDGIVVRGTGNAKFHYVVYAERAEIKGFQPVIRNEMFTPESLAKGDRLEALPDSTRALLVRNGTLNPDGTFNLQTAQDHGWTVPSPRHDPAAQRPAP